MSRLETVSRPDFNILVLVSVSRVIVLVSVLSVKVLVLVSVLSVEVLVLVSVLKMQRLEKNKTSVSVSAGKILYVERELSSQDW